MRFSCPCNHWLTCGHVSGFESVIGRRHGGIQMLQATSSAVPNHMLLMSMPIACAYFWADMRAGDNFLA